jgi:hypothetical protein
MTIGDAFAIIDQRVSERIADTHSAIPVMPYRDGMSVRWMCGTRSIGILVSNGELYIRRDDTGPVPVDASAELKDLQAIADDLADNLLSL